MNLLKRLFGKKETPKEFSQEELEQHEEQKSKALEEVLGKMHGMVGHAIIPFQVGGTVDMYYFPDHIKGTGFATMELMDPDGSGPLPNRLGTYELVAFTKYALADDDKTNPFHQIERRICGIFTTIGLYSRQAKLNPGETCEIPQEEGENVCLIFDKYPKDKDLNINDKQHHLLLCLEIFRSEMKYAKENGSAALLDVLKKEGVFPYSDMNRNPVM